jgi:hypothetical protein
MNTDTVTENQAYNNPIESQREEALKHYQEVSSKAHHWSGFVEAAIKAYNPTASPVSSEGEGKYNGTGKAYLSAEQMLEEESVNLSIDTGSHWSKHLKISNKPVYNMVINAMKKFAEQGLMPFTANDERLKPFSEAGEKVQGCDCVIPKPIDAYDPIDKTICRDCGGKINS